jgi:hypothetical protein
MQTSNNINEIRQISIKNYTQNELGVIQLEKQKYDLIISCIDRKILATAKNGLRKINIRFEPSYRKIMYFTHLVVENGYNGNIGTTYYLNKKILTDVVKELRRLVYTVKYLSIFSDMQGISIEW